MRRRIPSQLPLLATAFACMLALVACGSSAPVLQYLTISPVSGAGQAIAGSCGGDMVNFTANAYYSDGSIKDGTSLVTWASSNTAVATISAGGVATAVSPGVTTITAMAAGTPGATSNLTVTLASATSLAISPGSTGIPLGSSTSPTTQQYTLTGTFGGGATNPGSGGTEDLTTAATWASSSTGIATIGASTGLATAVNVGTTNISATIYCVTVPPTTSANVLTVTPPAPIALNIITADQVSSIPVDTSTPTSVTLPVGGTQQFAVQEVWSDGRAATPASNPSTLVFTISPTTPPVPASITSSGLATALATGTSKVDATEMVVSGGTTFTVGSSSDTYPQGTSGTITVAAAMARFAYVANLHDSSISEYAVNGSSGTPSGVLSPLGKFSEPNGPQQVLLHPSAKFLYSLGSDSSQSVTLFDVDPTAGALTSTGKMYTTTGSTSGSRAAMDAGGNYLYVANTSANSISAFSINQADGTLTSLSTLGANLSKPTFLLVDKSGPYLYAINAGNQSVSGYTINTGTNKPAPGPAGTLTPIASNGTVSMTATDSFTSAAIDPTGSFIYVPDGHGNVEAVTIGTGGALASLTGTPFPVAGASETRSVVVSPTATFLYVLDGSTSNPGVYILPLTAGKPGAVASHVPTGPAPVWIAGDVTGSLISVVNGGNNTLSTFTIGKGGGLTDSGFNPETAGSAQAMAFYTGTAEPTVAPAEVVAANSGSGNVAAFTAGAGGALTIDPTMGHYNTFAGNDFVAASSLTNLVVTGGPGAAQVAAFTATPSSTSASPSAVAHTAVSGSAFNISPATARPSAISIDATGSFIIAADTANGVVYGFSKSSSGINTTPVFTAAVAGVQALAVDPQGTVIYALTRSGISVALFKQTSPGSTAFTALGGTGVAGNWTVGGVDATGHFLVAFNPTAKAFSSFSISPVTGTSSDGTLMLEHADPAIIGHVTSFAFDPLGHYIMTADAVSNTVTALGFTPSTTATNLTALSGSAAITLPSSPGGSPGQMAFDASGQYLFIALSGVGSGSGITAGAVDVYTTNVKSGVPAFSEVKGAPFSAGTTSNALSTLGVGVTDSVQ
jgi:6-phosphogluconolactonase (cycloisomerase 2 family)